MVRDEEEEVKENERENYSKERKGVRRERGEREEATVILSSEAAYRYGQTCTLRIVMASTIPTAWIRALKPNSTPSTLRFLGEVHRVTVYLTTSPLFCRQEGCMEKENEKVQQTTH